MKRQKMAGAKNKGFVKPSPIERNRNSRKRLIIFSRALFLIAVFLALTRIHFEFLPLQEMLFLQMVFLLNFTGIEFETFGYSIIDPNFLAPPFLVTFDCTGWMQIYIYLSLLLIPVGISARDRLLGAAFVIPLYIYNTLRAVLSVYVGFTNYAWFKPVHYFLWEGLFLILIFVFWRYWYWRASGKALSKGVLKGERRPDKKPIARLQEGSLAKSPKISKTKQTGKRKKIERKKPGK
jgi:exosortase/archaeosortase family protein